MEDTERFRLLGKYKTLRFRICQRVFCQVRGEMGIRGMTEAPSLADGQPTRRRGRSLFADRL
jgi:hypothetical protein